MPHTSSKFGHTHHHTCTITCTDTHAVISSNTEYQSQSHTLPYTPSHIGKQAAITG
eukprot:m.170150 g.170150  ORF g.170150 m.170150 type:complete len:56 (+) comp18259_c0_seq6:1328-1495(+)